MPNCVATILAAAAAVQSLPARIAIVILVLAALVAFWWLIITLSMRMDERAARRRRQQESARPPAPYTPPAPPPGAAAPPVVPSMPGEPAPRPVIPQLPPPTPPAPAPTAPAPTPPPDTTPPAAPDLATFAPISDAELRAKSASLDRSAMFTFGRSSIIPPVTDPRTLLIDRALVAHGFLTPERLAEIHQVGLEMDAAKPDYAVAAQMAAQAVNDLEAERARIKAEKKAAAAERKRLHAEAVAHRKATDIVFLGRGVSKGLADRTSDLAKLSAAGLPALSTPADVAAALGLTVPRLRWLAFHADAAMVSHYITFTVPKRSGGVRVLSAPHESLAAAQAWILRNVLDKVPVSPHAHGFVRDRSIVTNARPHVDRDVVVNADLENFFPTVTFSRVLGIFKLLGYSPAVATILALLCTEAPRRAVTYAGKRMLVATGPRALPQGAATSPALSNLAGRRLDSRLHGIAAKLGYTYTRYADDLTFSADGPDPLAKVGYLLARLRHIAQDEGFVVNETKTRVLRRAARQEVTGVVVNKRPGIPRDTYRRLRAILHRAKREGLPAQNRENRPNFEMWLRGMIAYVSMVNERQGKELADALAEVG